jgi:transcriptional regulator with XRE-family HTH domain
MSFQIELDKYELAYARLVRRVQSAIQETFAQEAAKGTTQADLARELGVDASNVSRRINGSGNSTLRSISDLYVAMDREPLANFEPLEPNTARPTMLNVNDAYMSWLYCKARGTLAAARPLSANPNLEANLLIEHNHSLVAIERPTNEPVVNFVCQPLEQEARSYIDVLPSRNLATP